MRYIEEKVDAKRFFGITLAENETLCQATPDDMPVRVAVSQRFSEPAREVAIYRRPPPMIFDTLDAFFAFHETDKGDQRIERIAGGLRTLSGSGEMTRRNLLAMVGTGSFTTLTEYFSPPEYLVKAFSMAAVGEQIRARAVELVEQEEVTDPNEFCTAIINYCRMEIEWVKHIGGVEGFRMIRILAEREETDRNVA